MTNNSIPSFNTSISSSLHRKLQQTDGEPPASSADNNEKHEDMKLAAMKESSEESSHVDQKNTVKRIQMGFALKKEDVSTASHSWMSHASESEAQQNRTKVSSKSPRLTALVVSQGPVKIYQGLGSFNGIGQFMDILSSV